MGHTPVSGGRRWGVTRLVLLFLVVALAVPLGGGVAPVDTAELSPGLGTVDGVDYDDTLNVSVAEGVNDTELDRLTRRAMARIELIRGLEFNDTVNVTAISRDEYRDRAGVGGGDGGDRRQNSRWRALFVVGDDRDAESLIDAAITESIAGYYTPANGEIILVSEERNSTINRNTLVHELVHALQDQQFGLSLADQTTDSELARDALIEGEAEVITTEYSDRCGLVWACVSVPATETNESDIPLGIELVLFHPYAQGPQFVESIRERRGWSGIDAAHESPPETSTSIIHPDRSLEAPQDVPVPDRSDANWSRFGDPETDTLGEASIYAMLVHNDVVSLDETEGYQHTFSDGWQGDTFVPYQRGETLGYVWETAWASARDAEQFAFAYREVLDSRGAVSSDDGVFTVPEGSFDGAYRLTRENTTVRIVSAPTTDSLDGIHAD